MYEQHLVDLKVLSWKMQLQLHFLGESSKIIETLLLISLIVKMMFSPRLSKISISRWYELLSSFGWDVSSWKIEA